MYIPKPHSYDAHQIMSIIEPALRNSEDDDELRHRLAANGYGFADDADGRMLVTLPHAVRLFKLQSRRKEYSRARP